MDRIVYFPLGSTAQGRVVKVNEKRSAKLGLYSTIIQFGYVANSPSSYRGFFGIMLTECPGESVVKVGDIVDVKILTYRTSEFGGVSHIAAQCEFIRLVEEIPSIEAEKPNKASEDGNEARDTMKKQTHGESSNRERIKFEGAYICLHKTSDEGYLTTNKDGSLKLHRYGLWEKLYDVFKYGETTDIFYTYVVFYEDKGAVKVIAGNSDGELTTMVKWLKDGHGYRRAEDIIFEDDLMKFQGDKEIEELRLNDSGEVLKHTFLSRYTGKYESEKLTFMSWKNL